MALAILALGRRGFVRLTGEATVACIASTWLLGSWWPHSALHRHFGLWVGPLAGTELVFHAGSAVAAAVLVWALISRSRTHRTPVASAVSGPQPVAR